MFKINMKLKLAVLLLSSICLRYVTITFIPFGGASYFLANCFLLSLIPQYKKVFKELKPTIIFQLMLIMIVAAIICIANSPHYQGLNQWLRFFEIEFAGKYLVLALAFLCVRREKDLSPTVKLAFYGVLILTAIGLINFVTKSSFWVNELSTVDINEDRGSEFMYEERFRVQAMFANPFDYGFICMVMAYFFYYAKRKTLIGTSKFWMMETCCLFGVLSCGCRTLHVCFLMGVVVFMICILPFHKWSRYFIAAVIILIVSLPIVPSFQEYSELFVKALNTDETEMESGSSLAMRFIQLTSVIYYIKGYFLFGRGLDYFTIDLGWGDKVQGVGSSVDSDLYGMEGAYLSYLLERGVVGFLFYLLFYFTLFIYAYKMRKADTLTYGLFTTVIAVYFAFANMTGELLSVFPTLLILGTTFKILFVKSSYIKKRKAEAGKRRSITQEETVR